MKAMLAEHKVDLIPAVLPFALDPELQNLSNILFTAKDAIGVSEFVSFQARKPFIDAHRAALVDWFEDTLRILHWYRTRRINEEAAQIAGRFVKAPPERFRWVFTKTDVYRNPDMMPDLDCAAEKRRHDQGAWLRAGELRREKILRPQHGRGGGEAPEIRFGALTAKAAPKGAAKSHPKN